MSKTRIAALAISSVFVVAIAIGYTQRLQIGAWYWQIANHGILRLGAYRIPVPAGWYVSGGRDKLLYRLNGGAPGSPKGPHLPVTIGLSDERPVDIRLWNSVELSAATDRTDPVLEHDFTLDNEKMLCIGREIAPKIRNGVGIPLGWNCRSSGRLEIIIVATEADMPQIWEILSHVKKVD